MSEKNNYSKAIQDLENTLNGYDEKETRKIIMEFLKKHEDDYGDRVLNDDEDEEYEVYSNSSMGFNDDYVPEKYEDEESYEDYEEYYKEDDDNLVMINIGRKNKTSSDKKSYDSSYFENDNITYKDNVHKETERESKKVKSTAPIIAKIACVMVVILAAVVVFLFNRLNSDDEEIVQLKQKLSESSEYEIRIGELQTQVDSLNSQIEAYRRAFSDDNTDQNNSLNTANSSNNSENTQNTDVSQNTNDSRKTSTPKTYTVGKGDNLSKISKNQYGSDKYVEAIKEANNITGSGDNLSIGQTLIIPEI